MRAHQLSKADLSSSQQQNAAFYFNVVQQQNIQILQAAIVTVHKMPLKTHAKVRQVTGKTLRTAF